MRRRLTAVRSWMLLAGSVGAVFVTLGASAGMAYAWSWIASSGAR